MENRVCIIGLGYVGMTLAMHMVRKGYEVHGIETNETTYDKISKGETHFHEPGLEEILKLSLGDKFKIFKKVQIDKSYDFIILTVGTPLKDQEKSPDLEIFENAISSIYPIITENNLTIFRSTIPVGLTRKALEKIKINTGLSEINISFCPERTAEGKALEELQSLPQIISGNSLKALEKSRNFFETLTDEVIISNSLEEAELIKLFNNTYRDAIFALSNTFNQIAQDFNIDGFSSIEKSNYNYLRSDIPAPGFVAGPCLEKDAYILASEMKEGDLKEFILSIRKANEGMEKRFAKKISDFIKADKKTKILISGLAFKGVPQTNDLRGSSGIKIVNMLDEYKDNITLHDFMNQKKDLEKHTELPAINSEDIFLNNSDFDLIIILNNHPRYKTQKLRDYVGTQIKKGTKIIDSWGIMDLEEMHSLSNFFMES